jgi:putative alpha-1,2-mannosidase
MTDLTRALLLSRRVSVSANRTPMVHQPSIPRMCRSSPLLLSDASPGYFTQTLDNDIKIEATATRRAGLERFTFPTASTPYFVVDLANDLPSSFAGGTLDIDPIKGRITIGGNYGSR